MAATYVPVPTSSNENAPRRFGRSTGGGGGGGGGGNLFACSCNLPAFDMTTERRNLIVSYLAGLLFSAAWWLLIDAHVLSVANQDTEEGVMFSGAMLWYFYVPGIVSSIALVMINLVSPEAFSGDLWDDSAVTKARLFLFFAFILMFGGLLGSGWILFGLYVVPDEAGDILPAYKWPGIALLFQNLLIFASAIIMRFARRSNGN